jgi:hypothetical protein
MEFPWLPRLSLCALYSAAFKGSNANSSESVVFFLDRLGLGLIAASGIGSTTATSGVVFRLTALRFAGLSAFADTFFGA